MFDINIAARTFDNFHAGPFPVATEVGKVDASATIHARAPIAIGKNGIIEVTAATIENVIGISAAEPSGDEIVYYMTGEFFSQALHLQSGVTTEALRPHLRKLNIFLRERQRLETDPEFTSEQLTDSTELEGDES